MYGCKNWTVKKTECQRIDAFELWCWRRLLRVPWIARRSNQSILKEISPGCSLEGLTLKLKLQYFGHLMRRIDSLEKTLMLGGIGGRRKRGWQRMRWLDSIIDSLDVNLREPRESVMDREAWHLVIHGVAKSRTWLSDWTELMVCTILDIKLYVSLVNEWVKMEQWRTRKSGVLQSMGSQRVGHDLVTEQQQGVKIDVHNIIKSVLNSDTREYTVC